MLSASKEKIFLQIFIALSSIGYFIDKTFKPHGKLDLLIFFCLNKLELKIFSKLYSGDARYANSRLCREPWPEWGPG